MSRLCYEKDNIRVTLYTIYYEKEYNTHGLKKLLNGVLTEQGE